MEVEEIIVWRIFKFWYSDGLYLFINLTKNILLLIEEDLAVGMMLRLIISPLYANSSAFSKLLSICYRVSWVFLGASAMLLAFFLVAILAIAWFASPLLSFLLPRPINFGFALICLFGIGLFCYRFFKFPAKSVWQVKSDNLDELWKCSFVNRSKIVLSKLLILPQVVSNLQTLGLVPEDLIDYPQSLSESECLLQAFELAKQFGSKFIQPVHFLAAKIISAPAGTEYLYRLNLKKDDFLDLCYFLSIKQQDLKVAWPWQAEFQDSQIKGINRRWLGSPTPILDSVSEDLTFLADQKKDARFLGRRHTVYKIISLLSEVHRINLILVGNPGVGKTSLVKYLAELIAEGAVPEVLAQKRIVKLDLAKLGGSPELVFEEIRNAKIILVVDEINNFKLLTPYFTSPDWRFLLTLTPDSFDKLLLQNPEILGHFIKVELPAASVAETKQIVYHLAAALESKHQLKINILELNAVTLNTGSDETKQYLPGVAIAKLHCDLLDKAGKLTKQDLWKT